MDEGLCAILPDSASPVQGRMRLGGCDLGDLAARFDTPLYVYDEATLRHEARRVQAAFAPLGARVSFASKACSTLGVLRIFSQEGLGLDVVSAGELEAGIRAGFPASRIHLHGNAKTDSELEAAVRLQIHAVVVDNVEELARLQSICRRLRMRARVMLRLTLPLEAETHPHLQTSGPLSKFGFIHPSTEETLAVQQLAGSRWLQLVGLHAHLGSQIDDPGIFVRATAELVRVAAGLRDQGFPVEEVSAGGGWAVAYRPDDSSLAPETVADHLTPVFRSAPWLRPAVEPGRTLVARAGLALYRVTSVKHTGGRRVVAVDGGMGDNPRPALYGARYTAIPLLPFAPAAGLCDVVGRYCESGDVLVRDALLPEMAAGDLLCLPVSGAYHLSMSSAYNLVPPPAAVMVADGQVRLLTRRASIDDLLCRDVQEEPQEARQRPILASS